MSDEISYILQRLTAIILAPLVLLHLGLILYAIEGGLTSQEILNRTNSSILWPIIYVIFVIAAAIHAPLGLRNILREWSPIPSHILDPAMALFAGLLFITGMRAVWAIA